MHSGVHHAVTYASKRKSSWIDRSMVFVGIVGSLTAIPQIIQVWTDNSNEGISLLSYFLAAIFSLIWVYYGIVKRSSPLIISNVLWTIANALVVVGVLVRM